MVFQSSKNLICVVEFRNTPSTLLPINFFRDIITSPVFYAHFPGHTTSYEIQNVV